MGKTASEDMITFRPCEEKEWYELENMKAYFNLFKRFENKFTFLM